MKIIVDRSRLTVYTNHTLDEQEEFKMQGIINIETYEQDGIYFCCVSENDKNFYISETSFVEQKAIDKALNKLYQHLENRGIDPTTITFNKI